MNSSPFQLMLLVADDGICFSKL